MENTLPERISPATSQTARRVYLFQRPISGLDTSAPRAQSTHAGTPAWWDSDVPLDMALPLISERYTITSHIGVIIIEEDVCANVNLTSQQKLLAGVVYEHRGPDMESSQDRTDMEINAEDVKLFTALELVGHTTMADIQLNDLLTEILRVGGNPNHRPAYHTLYWNCQDVAIRLSLLAVSGDAGAIQVLARMFDMAKLEARTFIKLVWGFIISIGAHTVSNAQLSALDPSTLGTMLGPQFISPLSVFRIISRGPFMLREEIRQLVWDYKVLRNRCQWTAGLEQQFPQLRDLGHGHQVWQERADQAGIIPRLLGPFLFFVCGEVVT